MVCVPKAPAPLPWGHGQDLMGPVSPTRKEGPGVCAPPQAGAFHVSSPRLPRAHCTQPTPSRGQGPPLLLLHPPALHSMAFTGDLLRVSSLLTES